MSGNSDRIDEATQAEVEPISKMESVESTTEVEIVADEGGDHKVLFVDDELHILKAVRRLFVGQDYEVLTAESGEDAVDMLAQESIAVLVSDQRMPGMSGAQLLDYTRRNHPQITRIMLTGNNDTSTAMEAINKGEVFRFVTKPWDHDEFVRIVNLAMEHYELKVSKERYEAHIRTQNELLRQANDKLQRFNEELESAVEERTGEVVAQKQEISGLYSELQHSFDGMLKALLAIMELGEINIVDHCQRTAERVRQFGEVIGLGQEVLRVLERAALLHWIGLINAPPAMVQKSVDQFDAVEEATWDFHPLLGQQAICHVPALEEAGRFILHYLRRYDDPEFQADRSDLGLGNERNVEPFVTGCQVLAICSAFEQVRTAHQRRHGQKGKGEELLSRGLRAVEGEKGRRFDPTLVARFREMMSRELGRSKKQQIVVSFEELKSGMVLARPLETAQGIPVAPRDMIITDELLERLERFRASNGLDEIYVWA